MERRVQSRGWAAAAQVARPVYLFIRDPPPLSPPAIGRNMRKREVHRCGSLLTIDSG